MKRIPEPNPQPGFGGDSPEFIDRGKGGDKPDFADLVSGKCKGRTRALGTHVRPSLRF
jgi:alanine dehydrogenase